MERSYGLKVDSQLTFCINTQIKEQLKWLIGTGVIQPGDRLPSAGQLAGQLGLNRNTVTLVYNQLRDEGLVSMHKGRGTQVLDGAVTRELLRQRGPMHELLLRTIGEAGERGFPLRDFFQGALAYTLLHEAQTVERRRVAFIECRGHDHPFYREEIERLTGAEVRTMFLDELVADHGNGLQKLLDFSPVIVTTLNHAEEVKALLAPHGRQVVTIGAAAEVSCLMEMAGLEQDRVVSFVCLGESGGRWMASRVREAGITQIETVAAGLDDPDGLRTAVERSDRVYASAGAYPRLQTLGWAAPKLARYGMVLERSSENLLRELA